MIPEEQKKLIRTAPITELLELTKEAIGYVPEYFQEKWAMKERFQMILDVLEEDARK